MGLSEQKMDLKAKQRSHVDPGGFRLAAIYVLAVVFVFALTALTTKPDNVGLDWIPFVLLAVPWYLLDTRLLLPGLILNVGLMYLLGTLLHTRWRRANKK
jgi:hypothetical protein